MRTRLQLRTRQRQKFAIRKMAVIATFTGMLGGAGAWIYFNFGQSQEAMASEKTNLVSPGSFQFEVNNNPASLNAYGLIYDLIRNEQVPVRQVRASGTSSDCYIIPGEFIQSTVSARINFWRSKGVKGQFVSEKEKIQPIRTLRTFPTVYLDTNNSAYPLVQSCLNSTGIPQSAFRRGGSEPVGTFDLTLPSAPDQVAVKQGKTEIQNTVSFISSVWNSIPEQELTIDLSSFSLKAGDNIPVKAVMNGTKSAGEIAWKSRLGGKFNTDSRRQVTYSAPRYYSHDTTDMLTAVYTDSNGKTWFRNIPVEIKAVPSSPVTLTSFTGVNKEGKIELTWSTNHEFNSDYFTVERSQDNSTWEIIGRTGAAGQSQVTNNYCLYDQPVNAQPSFYRLAYTSFEGTQEILQTIQVNPMLPFDYQTSQQLRVDNSVFSRSFSFSVESKDNDSGQLRIFTANGKLIDTRQYELKKGRQVIIYEEPKLDNGVHVAVLQTKTGAVYSARIVKI